MDSLGLDIDDSLRTREYDYPDVDDNNNNKFNDVQSEYLLPIATGDPDLDITEDSPHDTKEAAENADPLSLDDPMSLALRRNRHILNPTSANQSASTSSTSTKGKLKTALSRSATSLKDMLTESMSRSSSRGDIGEDALDQTMVSGVPTSHSMTNLSSIPRSESKGSIGNRMKTALSRSSTSMKDMLTSSMVSSSSKVKGSSSLNYLQDSLDESIAPDRKCTSDPVYHKQIDIKTLILLNAEENLRPKQLPTKSKT